MEKNGRKRTALEIECNSCGCKFLKRKDWIRDKNYCNPQCSSVQLKTKVEVVCAKCSNIFLKRPSAIQASKSGLTFCSRKCKDDAQRLVNGFGALHPDHYGSTNRYRDIAYRVFPRKCMACSFFDEYPELMQVHHIDSDRNNNDISNLAVLCPTHHWAITIRKATMGQDRIWHWVG